MEASDGELPWDTGLDVFERGSVKFADDYG